jgi:transcription initiation factor IIF auxiliary subunit
MTSFKFSSYSHHLESKEDHELFAWCVFLDATRDELQQVRAIEYTLHPSFPKPVRTNRDAAHCFALLSQGWGEFSIAIRIMHSDGKILHCKHYLKLKSDSWPRGPLPKHLEDPHADRIYHVLKEGKTDWRKLSTISRHASVSAEEARIALERMESERIVRKAHFLSIDNEKLWGATYRVGLLPEPK